MHLPDLSTLAPFLSDVTLDAPWALLERLSTLEREHPDDLRRAALEVVGRLAALGIPVAMEEPELFLSVPRRAAVSAAGKSWNARPFSMSRNALSGVTAPLIYASITVDPATGLVSGSLPDVRGKFVVTRAPATGSLLNTIERSGATGVIAITAGPRPLSGRAGTAPGSPGLREDPERPRLVAVSVSEAESASLLDRSKAAEWVTVTTELTEGWFRSPIPLVRIPGIGDPGPFVLLHGHYDSWGTGVQGNALGTAALLEIARVLWRHRESLRRSVWIAWWPGHTTGADAGSVWFADRYGIDLYERCIAQVGCVAPGLRGSAGYGEVPCMSEAEPWAQAVIREVAGKEPTMKRLRGDVNRSFDTIGISGCFAGLSTSTGASSRGGEDSLQSADREVLRTDIGIYLATVAGLANATVAPLDFRRTMDELTGTVHRYQRAASKEMTFEPVLAEVAALKERLARFAEHSVALGRRPVSDPWVRRANAAVRRLARLLVPVNYATGPAFFPDPARSTAPLPDLAPSLELSRSSPDQRARIRTHLRRGQNRLIAALRDASAVVRSAMP